MLKKQTRKNKKGIKKTATKGNENIENLLKKQTEAILNVMDKKLEKQAATILSVVDKKLEKQSSDILGIMDKKFEAVDKKFEAIDQRFEAIDQRFEITDQKILRLEDTMNKRFEESEAKADQRFDRIMTNLDLILKRVTDTDDEIEFIKLDINRIKVVVKEKLGVNLM